MEYYSLVLFILGLMIVLSAVASKIKLPYPVLLITAGIGVGFIPDLPEVIMDPEIIFLVFLPPLLYDAAFNMPYSEFKAQFNTISALAISLVFLTAAGIAVATYYLIPGMSWPTAFVLGSILSTTDAVSAISFTKGLGLPQKTAVILKGESLVNDASALVAYRFAILAVTGTAFVLWKATIDFVVDVTGGILIGIVLGRLLTFILKRVHDNNIISISFTLLLPFIAYQLAEECTVSGVTAVVVLGLSISFFSSLGFTDQLKQQSKNFWDIIIFLLNGLIFILIGLEFPYVARTIPEGQILLYVYYALLITIVALLLRMARIFLHQLELKKLFQFNKKRVSEQSLLDFRTSLIISWSGMRGIVSLATAIAIPVTLKDGSPFPHRSEIIFISIVVVLFTIIGQGMSLPWLIRKLEVKKAPDTNPPVTEDPALKKT